MDRVAVADNDQAALFAVENDVRDLARRALIATEPFPGHRLAAGKFVRHHMRVGRFLIVLETVAAAGRM